MPPAPKQLRLLIVSGNLALLRGHYEGVIGGLVESGVHVSIRYLRDSSLSVDEYRATLRDAGIQADVAPLPRKARRPADLLALRLREIGNILRFSHPDYAGRDVLSERAFEKTGAGPQRWARRIRRLGPSRASAVARLVALIESTLPAPKGALALIAEERPDAIAAAPVIRIPALVDFLKAGASRGISTAIWVQSWDNLTNKGLLHFAPDRVFVWNDRQKEELTRYHGVGADHVCATGAQTFDHWFNGAPVTERTEFCRRLGIDPDRPIILYLASSKQIAPKEPTFFVRWLKAVRSSGDPVLESATVLVRPHPTMIKAWYAEGFDREPGVALSPATLRDQLNSDPFREQYRGELHHATVAVGINTSGLIDAAIFGKPTCTVELPELFHGQQGTVHFQHLVRADGGLLRTSSSLDEHTATLSELIRRDTYALDERSTEFVRAFVRPHGLDSQPTTVFVDEMLALCRAPSGVSRPTGARRAAGLLIAGIAVATRELTLNPKRIRKRSRRIAYAVARRVLPRPVRRAIRKRPRRIAYAVARRVLPRPVRRALRRMLGRNVPRPSDPSVAAAAAEAPASERS